MHYLIFPTKDSWIYSKTPKQNYGLDEILEITKEIDVTGSVYYSRIVMQFSIPNAMTASSIYYLNVYTAMASNLPSQYTLEAYPISSSWENGTGFATSTIVRKDGVSWGSKNATVSWSNAGGDYLTSSICSQSFSYENPDIRMDVSSIAKSWISSSISNNGFILKRTNSGESSSVDYGRLVFYSKDTNTIYLPTLEGCKDDYIFNTGSNALSPTASFEALTTDKIAISMINLKSEYKYNTTPRFRIKARDLYQRRTFVNTSITGSNIIKYLPKTGSFYSVVDAYNGRTLIPFSDYTKISCDGGGNYFDLSLSGFMPKRFYKLIFKVTMNDVDSYYDNNYTFKVVK